MKKLTKKINANSIPLSSSLGHLAYGHIAFLAWRKKKELLKNEKEKK